MKEIVIWQYYAKDTKRVRRLKEELKNMKEEFKNMKEDFEEMNEQLKELYWAPPNGPGYLLAKKNFEDVKKNITEV
jgi:seryl-tRNA synthetase